MNNSPLLVATNVSWQTPQTGRKILNSLTTIAEGGHLYVLSGLSGIGKSSLLNIFAGFLKADKGAAITFDGSPVHSMSTQELTTIWGSKIGFVFQQDHFVPGLDTIENILVGQAESSPQAHQHAKLLMTKLGIDKLSTANPENLSGGERRRVSVARAMVQKPQLLLADEPDTSLDDAAASAVRSSILNHVAGGGTCIVATHSAEPWLEDSRLADQPASVWRLVDGQISTDDGWSQHEEK